MAEIKIKNNTYVIKKSTYPFNRLSSTPFFLLIDLGPHGSI